MENILDFASQEAKIENMIWVLKAIQNEPFEKVKIIVSLWAGRRHKHSRQAWGKGKSNKLKYQNNNFLIFP